MPSLGLVLLPTVKNQMLQENETMCDSEFIAEEIYVTDSKKVYFIGS